MKGVKKMKKLTKKDIYSELILLFGIYICLVMGTYFIIKELTNPTFNSSILWLDKLFPCWLIVIEASFIFGTVMSTHFILFDLTMNQLRELKRKSKATLGSGITSPKINKTNKL